VEPESFCLEGHLAHDVAEIDRREQPRFGHLHLWAQAQAVHLHGDRPKARFEGIRRTPVREGRDPTGHACAGATQPRCRRTQRLAVDVTHS
jgi:hypothetical protein